VFNHVLQNLKMENNIIKKYIEHNHFGKLLGMHFEIINDGEVIYYFKIKPEHLATPHAAHGGAISVLVDATLGVSCLSAVCKENKVISTVEFKVNFLSPALLNDELVANGKVIQKGKRILVSECSIHASNRENILIAKAIGTFNAYEASVSGY
jgi:uncharacterized protein (TIGR00369 family)